MDANDRLNRYSMPVTRSRTGLYDMGTLDQTNTTRFLFGDDESSGQEAKFGQTSAPDENFPTLVRYDAHRVSLSWFCSSAARGASQIRVSISQSGHL